MKKAIAYTRVSTTGQAENGAGLNLQKTAIGTFANAAGYEIKAAFFDTHTGVGEDSIKDRDGIQAALEMARRTGWTIIVDGLDRISRHSKTLEALIADNGIRVISTRDGEAPSRPVLLACAARAQAEAQRISESTKKGLASARESGVLLGNRTNLPEAQKLGASMNRIRATARANDLAPVVTEIMNSGVSTHKEIADELNRRGILSPRGKAWTASSIRRPLARIGVKKMLRPDKSTDTKHNNPLYGIF